MPAVALDHARQRQPCKVQHGAQVDVDQQVDAVGVGLEQGTGFVDAGVVDQDVEGVLGEQLGQPGKVGHVDGVGDAAGPGRQFLQLVGTTSQGMHLHAFLAQAFDNGGADAGGSPGDQRGFVVGKWHGVVLVLRVMVRLYPAFGRWTKTQWLCGDKACL